ncbi:radical SAM protein [Kitasatospora atroaurantiaca]|uniref:radical SAM protein n=1 Tax=Kitasatospora atroaurantiaca TaxID=285545 RepID=UPI001BAD8190|nr:radical SAM protein [Kitasatospora atroaurantiaca]
MPSWALEFDWHLTNRCDFFCEYCHPQIRYVLNRKYLDEPSPELVKRRFDELGKTCLVHMSGGEPFMFPRFVDLCVGLTEHHFISINTNLASGDVESFSKLVDPNRVARITAAVHMPERERRGLELAAYARNYLHLDERGFDVTALYVLYPPLLGRLAEDLDRLRSLGVTRVQVKVFKGVHGGVRYPEGYTEEQKRLILSNSGEYLFNRSYLDGLMSFRGQACTAGVSSFKVMVTGDVRRCASVPVGYGNLYDGSFRPSEVNEGCPARRVLVLSQCLSYLVDPPAAHGHSGEAEE